MAFNSTSLRDAADFPPASGAPAGGSDPFVTLTVRPDTGLGFQLEAMEAVEELGRPFLIVLDVSAAKPKNDLHAILGSTATVKLDYPGKASRHFSGIVTRLQYRGLSSGGYRYQVELRPWIWLLSREQDCRIFQNKSPWQIMTGLFRDAGFTDFADKRQNGTGDNELGYCVQYRETTLDFVTRLMELYGLYYYVTHADGTHTINFADDPNSHASAGAAIPYGRDETDWRAVDDHLWDWSVDAQIEPGACTLRDHNFRTPKADSTVRSRIAGGHSHGSAEVYDYPGRYSSTAVGQKVVQVRMQEFDTRRQVYGGTSNSRRLGAGTKFTLSEFPDPAGNQEYLVTHSTCRVERAEARAFRNQDEIIDTFRCVLRAVPGSRPFRLAPITPRPLIPGSQTARVVGEAGQEITTDQHGRVKVKFHWDRSPGENENSSCWLRVTQSWAGPSWGTLFIPRIGQEVVVDFGEGNPDRPMVTGVVYNGDNRPPYTLPDNKTRSTTKSSSSLGGSGFNEWRFEDKKGAEEIYMHAQKDFNEVILGSHTESIGGDTTSTVNKGNRSYTISAGTDTLDVASDRTVKIKGNDDLTVTGDRFTTLLSSHQVRVTGDVYDAIAGRHDHKVGKDYSLTVSDFVRTQSAGAWIVSAEAICQVTSKSQVYLGVGGVSVTLDKASITLSVGGSSIKLTPAGVTITGPTVNIN